LGLNPFVFISQQSLRTSSSLTACSSKRLESNSPARKLGTTFSSALPLSLCCRLSHHLVM
jgi:hypothetical protein